MNDWNDMIVSRERPCVVQENARANGKVGQSVNGITTCTHCKVEPCTCAPAPFPATVTMKEPFVIRGSDAHQAQCKHPYIDPVANACINCEKLLGPSMPEQLEQLRTRVAALEVALSLKVEAPP